MAQRERLNRFLARAGIASRRASDRLILAGQIQVNGVKVDQPGTRVDPELDQVVYNGKQVFLPNEYSYVLLNKPPGYLVSADDPHHSRTVYDLLEGISVRVVPVGRLDLDTWGVLLFMDDGDLHYRLTHPRFKVKKTYRALVRGIPSSRVLRNLQSGVELSGVRSAPANARLVGPRGENGVLELTVHEGRKHQVKQMCLAVGHPVIRLERVAFAGISTKGLQAGKWRNLSVDEVKGLKATVGLDDEN